MSFGVGVIGSRFKAKPWRGIATRVTAYPFNIEDIALTRASRFSVSKDGLLLTEESRALIMKKVWDDLAGVLPGGVRVSADVSQPLDFHYDRDCFAARIIRRPQSIGVVRPIFGQCQGNPHVAARTAAFDDRSLTWPSTPARQRARRLALDPSSRRLMAAADTAISLSLLGVGLRHRADSTSAARHQDAQPVVMPATANFSPRPGPAITGYTSSAGVVRRSGRVSPWPAESRGELAIGHGSDQRPVCLE